MGSNVAYVLAMVGLPCATWARPYEALSNSEQSRARLARSLSNASMSDARAEMPGEPVLVDEYTTELDRLAAKQLCEGLLEYLLRFPCRVILATVFEDVAHWLAPDWIFLTRTGT